MGLAPQILLVPRTRGTCVRASIALAGAAFLFWASSWRNSREVRLVGPECASSRALDLGRNASDVGGKWRKAQAGVGDCVRKTDWKLRLPSENQMDVELAERLKVQCPSPAWMACTSPWRRERAETLDA